MSYTKTKTTVNTAYSKVFPVFTSRCLVAAFNSGRSLSSGFPNWPRPQLSASQFSHMQVKVTLRLMVSKSISLGVNPLLGLMTRYLLLFDSYGLVFLVRPL
jgi:hypothetical protein